MCFVYFCTNFLGISFDKWLNSDETNGFSTRLRTGIQNSPLDPEIQTNRIDAVSVSNIQRFPPAHADRKVYLGYFERVESEMKGSFWGVHDGKLRLLNATSLTHASGSDRLLVQFVYITQSSMEMVSILTKRHCFHAVVTF